MIRKAGGPLERSALATEELSREAWGSVQAAAVTLPASHGGYPEFTCSPDFGRAFFV